MRQFLNSRSPPLRSKTLLAAKAGQADGKLAGFRDTQGDDASMEGRDTAAGSTFKRQGAGGSVLSRATAHQEDRVSQRFTKYNNLDKIEEDNLEQSQD